MTMSTSSIVKTDVYPPVTTNSVANLPKHLNVNSIISSETILPFELMLDKKASKIYYSKLDVNSKKFLQHFGYIVSDIFNKSYAATPITWLKIHELLSKLKVTKKNVNNKTCIKFNMHAFAVKSCFTSGLRCVETDCEHLLQIGEHPMYIYFIGEERARNIKFNRQNRAFCVKDEWKFARVKLNSHTKYTVLTRTFYVLNSACMNYFSIHVLPHGTIVNFEVLSIHQLPAHKPYERFEKPRILRNLVDDKPSTPWIEPASPAPMKRSYESSTASTLYEPCTPRIEDVDRDQPQPSTSKAPDPVPMDGLDDDQSTEASDSYGDQQCLAQEIPQHYDNIPEEPSHTVTPVLIYPSEESQAHFQERDPALAGPEKDCAQTFITIPSDYIEQYYTSQPPAVNTVENLVNFLKSAEAEIMNSQIRNLPRPERLHAEVSNPETVHEISTPEDPSQERMRVSSETLESSSLSTIITESTYFEEFEQENSITEDSIDRRKSPTPPRSPDVFDEPLRTPMFQTAEKSYPAPITPLPVAKPVDDPPESAAKGINPVKESYSIPVTALPAAEPVVDSLTRPAVTMDPKILKEFIPWHRLVNVQVYGPPIPWNRNQATQSNGPANQWNRNQATQSNGSSIQYQHQATENEVALDLSIPKSQPALTSI